MSAGTHGGAAMSEPSFPTTEEQVEQANASGRTPVVFIHGLWLLPSSWDRWAKVFDDSGYAPLTPGWPDDPNTVEEANASIPTSSPTSYWPGGRPLRCRGRQADKKPAVIGHSFGGLLTQITRRTRTLGRLGRDRPGAVQRRIAAAALSLKSAFPVLGNPRQPAPRGPSHL